jgi:hypothetical protein
MHLRGEQTYYVYVAICMHACMHTGRAPPCMRSIDLHIYAATVCTRALAILVDRAAIILYVLRATVHRTSFHPSDPWPLLADVIETKRRADRRNPSFPRPCLAGSLARSPPPPLSLSHRIAGRAAHACLHARYGAFRRTYERRHAFRPASMQQASISTQQRAAEKLLVGVASSLPAGLCPRCARAGHRPPPGAGHDVTTHASSPPHHAHAHARWARLFARTNACRRIGGWIGCFRHACMDRIDRMVLRFGATQRAAAKEDLALQKDRRTHQSHACSSGEPEGPAVLRLRTCTPTVLVPVGCKLSPPALGFTVRVACSALAFPAVQTRPRPPGQVLRCEWRVATDPSAAAAS